MSIIKVTNLFHSYNSGKNWAVRDVNFEIHSKGIVGLLGSNGAGKSTTMNIICGVINHTKGTVEIDGIDIRKQAKSAKLNLGFLPQDPPLYLDLTVDEYLNHCARLRLMDSRMIPNAIEEVKEKVQVTHFSDRLLKNLSGGYRQRVGIAQAIIHKPKLVVLDEPTVGLDPNQIIEVRNLVREIATDRAVLISTHILSEVELMCKDVIMIEAGKVVFNGSLNDFKMIETIDSAIVRFDSTPALEEFAGIAGITFIEQLNDKEFRIGFNGVENMTGVLIKESVARNWNIQEVFYEQISLDSVFAKLSKEQTVQD